MYETLLGRDGFRKGMDLYFQRHDGTAVTCDDFRAAMQAGSVNHPRPRLAWVPGFQSRRRDCYMTAGHSLRGFLTKRSPFFHSGASSLQRALCFWGERLILRHCARNAKIAAGRQWPRPLAVREVVLPGGHAGAEGRRHLGPGAGDLHLDAAPWLSLWSRERWRNGAPGFLFFPRRVFVSLQHVGGFAWGPGRARRGLSCSRVFLAVGRPYSNTTMLLQLNGDF